MLIILNRHVQEIQVQRNGDENDFKMVKKDTLEKLWKELTMNMGIMGKADISGIEKLQCLRVEHGGFDP